MIGGLFRAAEERPDHIAVVSHRGDVTYGALRAEAETVAANLVGQGVERFGVIEPDPARVLALLAASSLVGAEACVYPLAASDDDAGAIAARFGHEIVVTERPLPGVRTVSPLSLTVPAGAVPIAADKAAAGGPLMVMTTGTSGHPRGVRHDWERVLRATGRIKPAPDQRWLLAYGLNQFGGLQILLHVIAAQATLVAGETFQPRDGLAAMRRWGVTHASGTPTFWRFLLSELYADGGEVPALQQVTLGGEAVPAPLLRQLREAFPVANISQIYGATEFGQNVTVRDGLPGLPLELIEAGAGDLQFKVVDGELWVRSGAAMLGYHGEEPVDRSDWRATGDLVEIVGARVEFRGRRTDVINVGGVKVHPLPVEERISALPGVALVRAFGRPNPLTGSIVAVEIVPVSGADPEALQVAARAACADLPPAARPRSVRVVSSMETTGNKMNRGSRR